MPRRAPEVADIFRTQGPVWRSANAGHVGQLEVTAAIERCRTAAAKASPPSRQSKPPSTASRCSDRVSITD